ncbi:receptor-type tyrosine-protein phosphatase eta isoform X8 [Gymnodraco acuticeps]|uniref:protein-tyrosine-phosphatase n=1 Tax=Gymnodraco acuticeps TaxID=8218 RepID=A0A6P8U4N4_GYMAC|nr:receptor-type tyrosine-protein phosphatase eta isoform X8 [Gymnodraco acuticeps]
MKPLLRSSSDFLWILFFFCALPKVSTEECGKCDSNITEYLTTTTTTVTIGSNSSCNISIWQDLSANDLIPGAIYQIYFDCFNCCKEATTKPQVVRNISVTEITTSSISVMWNEPEGSSSSYRVQWSDGNVPKSDKVNQTQINITDLTAGVQYDITITAVAGDGSTEGESTTVSQYTKPEVVRNLSVTEITTSSISVMWNEPEGSSSFYRVHWIDGNVPKSDKVNQTQINITDLTAGVQYDITITAVAGDGSTEGESTTVSRYTRPQVVRNLSVTEITTSSISVMWNKPEGNSCSYRVQWSDGNVPKSDKVTETNITITDLTAGVQYGINVTAVAGDGSTEGESTTVSRYTKPEVVRNLSVTEITTSSISVMWNKPEGNSSSFRVQWSDGNVPKSDKVNQTQINITNLTAGVHYDITITAVAGDGSTEGESTTVSQYTKPEVVRNLSVTEITTSSISVMWNTPEGNSSSYRVQWIDGNVTKSDKVTETNITITDLTAGVQYGINVTAVAGDGSTEGESTTVSRYTKPEVVRNLSVTEITTSSISVMWNEPEGSSSFYRVQWSDGNVTKSDKVNQTQINITDLTAGVHYDINVTAVAGDGSTEGESTTVSRYTKPEVVRNLSVTEITTSSISVMWNKPEGNSSSYRVQWSDGNVTKSDKVTETNITITDLTAGVQYGINVTAVAGDGSTEGESTTVSRYTKPEVVRNLSVTEITTSSISVMWNKPEGNSSSFRVQWSDGNVPKSDKVNQTQINISNLTAGVHYDITITAVAGDGSTEGESTTVSQYTKPEVVRNLSVTEITTSSISVMWNEPEGSSSSYRAQWSDGNIPKSDKVNQTQITITDLTAGVHYDINVTAVAGDGSTEGESTTVSRYTRPQVVRNLSVTEITTSSISVMWNKPEWNSSSFRVQWSDRNVPKSDKVNQTQINISNLTAGVQYDITITAVAGDGSTEGESTTVSQYTKPEVVRNLSVTEITTSSISVMWNTPEGNSSSYRVQWIDGNVTKSDKVTETNITITDLTAGVQYGINVTAVAGDGSTEGQSTTVSRYTKPEVVRNLSVTEITISSISVMWNEPEGSSSFYRVQWSDGNVTKRDKVNQTQINITDLTAGVHYDINVTAVAGDGSTEGESTTVSRYTKPEVVRNLSVTEITTSSISVMWNKPEGNSSSFRVQWSDGNVPKSDKVNQTQINISNLTAGVHYDITITAVAGDGSTEGESTTVSQYTKPEVVRNLSVTEITTSSISVMWNEPEGSSSFYRVQWSDGNIPKSDKVNQTQITITDLTAGVHYDINVTAVAGDGSTEGESTTVSRYTKPEVVRNLSVTEITTSSISVMWNEPEGNSSFYRVQWIDGNVNKSENVTETNITISKLTAGVHYDITITAVAGDGSTEGQSTTVSRYTKPAGVENLSIIAVTNSSVSLIWKQPKGNVSSYSVQWNAIGKTLTLNNTTIETNFTINNLIPGVQYNILVAAVAGKSSNKGAGTSISTFTSPEKPENIKITARGTSDLTIEWTLSLGSADHYVVNISNKIYSNSTTTAGKQANFTDLFPGRLYDITVTAVAGNFSETSEQSSFATKPTPPGSIIISQRTNCSLFLRWDTPVLMDGAPSISYNISYQHVGGEALNKISSDTHTELTSLLSGKSYNITVQTVGPQSLKSTAVQNASLTLPNPVLNLEASPKSTTSVKVSWSQPQEAWSYYEYLVQAYKTTGELVFNITVSHNSADVTSLEPGNRYNINVTTIAAAGSESTMEQTFSYTMPKAVSQLIVEYVNTTAIRLTWLGQSDHKPSYSYLVIALQNTRMVQNSSIYNESFTFCNLTPGELYTFYVFTVVEGVKSTVESISNYTRPYSVTNLRETEITTDSVTLEWEQPKDKNYSYVVQTSMSSFNSAETVRNKHNQTIHGLLSGSNYSFTVTTQTADGTEAAPMAVSYFTRPYSIEQLKADTLNSTAVHLVWTKPPEYKSEFRYRVEYAEFDYESKNKSSEQEDTEISGLIAGTNYTFCVFVMAANGIEGEARCTSQYTKPEAVQPSISSQESNNSVLVSWTKPPGKVENYTVFFKNIFTTEVTEEVLDFSHTSFLFANLSAGMLYRAKVTTFCGPFNASSGFVTNATYPNTPGGIYLLDKNTSSIFIRWEEAPLMTNASFQYKLIIVPHAREMYNTSNIHHTFDSLLSGTSYNISVATVGVMGFESAEFQLNMVTTRPFSVKSLKANPEEERISVMWTVPDKDKTSYRYIVTLQSSDGFFNDAIVTTNESYFDTLDPGKQYNISVTTETSDGTKGAPEWISKCTNASPVKDLKCEGPNTTKAELILKWEKPNGQYSGFKVKYNGNITSTKNCCGHTVTNLTHYTEYNLTMETQSCGLPSTPQNTQCWTGITNPSIPANFKSLVNVGSTLFSKFTLQIYDSLLDNTNGPITHVGVLVTNDLKSSDTANWTQYLGKTYSQWKTKHTSVYLATVTEIPFQKRSGESHFNIAVGDESHWKGYTNGALDANGKYQYAIVLFTGLVMEKNLVLNSASLMTIAHPYPVVILPQNPAIIGIAVGVTLGIFCVLFIILIGFIVYWKRVSNKESSDIQIFSMRAKVSLAVRVEDFEAYYKKQKADSNCGFAEEFEDLKMVGTAQLKTNAERLENKPKNRYANVLPYDSSRVKLSIIHGSPYDDYINANYMPGYNSRKEFIAAQGPLPGTVNDFWRMIWEKNVRSLVMLTRCNEQGRVKCEQYWVQGTKHFENITVTTTSEIALEDWTIRDFDIKNVKTAETRSVRHFHFTAWPDHGVPQTTELLISFRHLVREHMDQFSRHSPTVVHCSAGVGRTGTFIAIDHLMFQIERENIVDVFGIVYDLRMHRPLMVQTEDQYVFLNQCAIDIIRSRTGTNVDLIYQNAAALSIYENIEPKKRFLQK